MLSVAWAVCTAAELSDAAVTAQNRAMGTTPRLRVGDHDAQGDPCGFGRACNVWSSVMGLGESSLHRRDPRRDLSAMRPRHAASRTLSQVNSTADEQNHPQSVSLQSLKTGRVHRRSSRWLAKNVSASSL